MIDVWTEYKPVDQARLLNTNLSQRKLRLALDYLCRASKSALKIEVEKPFDMLFVADELIGKPEFLDNKHLGRVLHIRNMIIEKLWDNRACVRLVRRWDRRMIEALPGDEK